MRAIKGLSGIKRLRVELTCLLLFAALAADAEQVVTQEPPRAVSELNSGWNTLVAGMQEARRSLWETAFFPPPASDRGLAEGHRYLLAHLVRMIEIEMRADPLFPEFFHTMDMLRKWTGENPDAAYLKARIDATGYYRLTVQAKDTTEWLTSERHLAGPKAPRLVIFQTITDILGNSGDLAEMTQCRNQTLDAINSLRLQVDAHNSFNILIGPEKPDDYQGNFLYSSKLLPCSATGAAQVRQARWLSVKEIFSDWANERRLAMDIVRLDAEGENKPPITVQDVNARMARIGEQLPNQIRFWSALQAQTLELYGDFNKDGKRPLPVNSIYQPKPPFTAGGIAAANTLYASGKFELEADQALIIKVTTPMEPYYIGFMLNNFWLEGADQQNYVSSLTGSQLPASSDGTRYYVIAHRDPEVDGWISTTGLSSGSHLMRFVFREEVGPQQLPQLEATVVDINDIGSVLPASTKDVTGDQRRAQISMRQRHIKWRWL